MARFLSREWFDDLCPESKRPARTELLAGAGSPQSGLLFWVTVTGAPEGEVRYQVLAEGGQLKVLGPGAQVEAERCAGSAVTPNGRSSVAMTADYATMSAIAAGSLSPAAAFAGGRAHVSGEAAALALAMADLRGADLVPSDVRSTTTF